MKNCNFVVDVEGEKISAILPIKDFFQIESHLKENLCKALCPKVFQLLNIPDKAAKFLNLLLQSSENTRSHHITITDDEIAINEDKRTIKIYRKELKNFMEKKNVKVIDISYNPPTIGKGTTYTLNFLQIINTTVDKYSMNRNLSFFELIRVINILEQDVISDLKEIKNEDVAHLFEVLINELQQIKGKTPKIDILGQYNQSF